MEKRLMENLGISPSLLGFGCMRFPVTADGKIDEATTEKMLDRAMELGVTYYDTAYPYHNGDSEPFVGRVLNKYDRSSYFLATKLPIWLVESREEAEKKFYEQLERLDKEYVDFYLIHALDKERFEKMKELDIVSMCEDLRSKGKIRYLGFSFHDDYEVFEEIINYHHWDFCQIQYNYMDTEIQAGDKGYRLAEEKGIPMVIMEPVRGGLLSGFSQDIEDMFRKVNPDKSVASWALRWVASHPNVKVVLSGMSDPAQVEDNLNTFNNFQPLSDKEEETVKQVVDTLRARVQNRCTGCRYCMPCPQGVNIPDSFRIWNDYHIYQKYGVVKDRWEGMKDEEKPKNCVECGACEEQCPQKINIREDLKRVQAELDAPQWK
ncbi:MAG TPA: aldo/keto reductase [Candidatus Pullilachnospira stercoravium]|uniref:Aldo/keto reductase n=1 Tax=Candidatus Pullilachnospira stercoravium TaxID=2840913 RepID=A0A9D1T7M3_9FIRM|nr:aldo/keto reductase [Candidatus Pullilachnospira stercoravium]